MKTGQANDYHQIEEEELKLIYSDTKWHSWKCRCGCLNRRSSGNCSRCGGMVELYSHFYGDNGYVNPNGRRFS